MPSPGYARRAMSFIVFFVTIAVAMGLLTVLAVTTAAQGGSPSIQESMLQLWPEYDDPGLLVIYSGTLTGTTGFPVQAAFPLPSGARGIQATVRDPQRGLLSQEWELRDGKLVYSLPGPDFHIEYYLERPPSGEQRELSYRFEVPYDSNTLQVVVQQPDRATDFSMTPAAGLPSTREDGLTYHELARTGLKAGETLDLAVSYRKPDQELSRPAAPAAAPAPEQPATQPVAQDDPLAGALPWILIGIGAAGLLGALGYWWLRGRRPVSSPATPARVGTASPTAGPPAPAKRAMENPLPPAAFCTQCGHRMGAEDRFCANCGAPRKGASS